MTRIEEIAGEIVRREGGYVNDRDDPGGATKYGVTIKTMQTLGLDLSGDGRVDSGDVKMLTQAQAVQIFVEHYFRKPRLAELPEPIQPSVFDMYVNAGTNAIKILQKLISRMGFRLRADGMIGPVTIAAARTAAEVAPEHFADAYGIARRNYYYALADRRPASRKYARQKNGNKGGWISRAESFITPKYHLTPAEHQERIAAWG